MKNLEKLLSDNDNNDSLTKEDLYLLLDALHSHQRSEIAYLLSIQEAMTEAELYQHKRDIDSQHHTVKAKILALIDKM